MRKLLLLLFISTTAAGQKKITDISGRAAETAYLEPVGRIGAEFFYLNTHFLTRLNLETFETTRLVSSLDKNINYVSLISHGRLFYAFLDFPEVIINEVDTQTGEIINRFSFPNSSQLSKINDVYYIVRDNLWVRISFDESGIYTEEIAKYDPADSGGSLRNRIIQMKNKAGGTVKGFWDDRNNFYFTKNIEVGLSGQEFADYYVFYRHSGFEKAFLYHKPSGKEISISSDRALAFLRFFEGELGEMYLLESFARDFSGQPGVLYKLYRVSEEGNKDPVMDIELRDYNYYVSGGSLNGPGTAIPYSNILYFNKHIYFWVGDSKFTSTQVSMKLVAVNPGARQVTTLSLPEEAVKALQFYYPPYGLQLIASGEKVVAVTDTEDYLSISCDPRDFKLTPEKGKNTLQRRVMAVNDTLHLNFSYPQKIIKEGNNHPLMQVIRDSVFYEVNAFRSYFATPSKLIIPDGFHFKTYTYDGEELRAVPDPIRNSYLRLASVSWTGIQDHNKHLIYAHGLRLDGTTGGDYYTFDSSTDQTLKVFSFNSPYLIWAFAAKASTGEFVLIDLNEGKYVITDFEDYFDLTLPGITSGMELICNFANKTFLLKGSGARVYHFHPGSGTLKNTGVETYGGNFYGPDSFYTLAAGTLIKIDENGNSETIIGPDASLRAEKIGDDEAVFFTFREFGKIELASGNIVRHKMKANSWSLVRVFKLNDRHFAMLSDGELVRVDFNTGSFYKIATERFLLRSGTRNGKVYLTRYDEISRETEVWEFDGKDVRMRFGLDESVFHSRDSFSEPAIFHNSDHSWQLWWPAEDKVIKPDSAVLKNYWEFRYLGETKDVGYFAALGSDIRHIISVNARSKQVNVLFGEGEYFRIFDEKLFIGTEEGIWKSDPEGTLMTLETRLKVAPLYPTQPERNFFEFKNNLYFWAKDEKDITQLYRLTNKTPEEILLPAENLPLNFSFYPNPVQDHLNISSTAESPAKYKITVFSTDGKILSEKESALPQKLDLSGLKSGIYLINVRTEGASRTFRVVKS